jgi:hypothetical protein
VSNHKPISLSLTFDLNLGPIPFRFNPRWIQEEGYSALVARIWNESILGSPFYVWEGKLRKLKRALKEWAKTLPNPISKCLEARQQLEAYQLEIEKVEPSEQSLQQEARLQKDWHQACREEEKHWQQKSRCLWLEAGDKNTAYFHKQAEARKQFKMVTKIRSQGQIITDIEGIKEAAVQTFEALYTESHTEASDPSSYPLNLIQEKIQEEVNRKLIREIDQ